LPGYWPSINPEREASCDERGEVQGWLVQQAGPFTHNLQTSACDGFTALKTILSSWAIKILQQLDLMAIHSFEGNKRITTRRDISCPPT